MAVVITNDKQYLFLSCMRPIYEADTRNTVHVLCLILTPFLFRLHSIPHELWFPFSYITSTDLFSQSGRIATQCTKLCTCQLHAVNKCSA